MSLKEFILSLLISRSYLKAMFRIYKISYQISILSIKGDKLDLEDVEDYLDLLNKVKLDAFLSKSSRLNKRVRLKDILNTALDLLDILKRSLDP